jgi:hypothetical protein
VGVSANSDSYFFAFSPSWNKSIVHHCGVFYRHITDKTHASQYYVLMAWVPAPARDKMKILREGAWRYRKEVLVTS